MDWEQIIGRENTNDISDNLEQLNDVVGDTRITGFERLSESDNTEIIGLLNDHVPVEHLKDCPEIKYSPENSIFQDNPTIKGFFRTDTHQIEIASRESFETINDMAGTVAHEVGHNAFELLENNNPQASERWKEMYTEAWAESYAGFGFVSEYAKTNPYEDFAESYRTYIEDPELLKFMNPAKYEFMKNIVFFGREYGRITDENGNYTIVDKSVMDALCDIVSDGIDIANDESIQISDTSTQILDTYRCFNKIA